MYFVRRNMHQLSDIKRNSRFCIEVSSSCVTTTRSHCIHSPRGVLTVRTRMGSLYLLKPIQF